jgi:hypothetical protein
MTARRRPPKYDRFTHPDASPADTINWHVCAPYDRAVRDAELKWGVDRLPELVPVDLAEKYGRAVAALNAAIQAEDTEAVRQNAINCARGLAKLDEWAEANGCPKSNPATIEFSDGDKFKFAILKDERDWPALKAQRPDLLFFTEREVVNALKAYHAAIPALEHIKQSFPDAKVSKLSMAEMVDDEIIY